MHLPFLPAPHKGEIAASWRRLEVPPGDDWGQGAVPWGVGPFQVMVDPRPTALHGQGQMELGSPCLLILILLLRKKNHRIPVSPWAILLVSAKATCGWGHSWPPPGRRRQCENHQIFLYHGRWAGERFEGGESLQGDRDDSWGGAYTFDF